MPISNSNPSPLSDDPVMVSSVLCRYFAPNLINTHPVIFTIPGIHSVNLFTGILVTLKTKNILTFRMMVHTCAFAKQVSTFSVFRSAADTGKIISVTLKGDVR